MNTLDMICQDVRFALRSLRRARGFTAAVVITLALGSGANAAIFAIYNAALLRRLPVPAPERLVNLSSPGPKSGRTSTSSTARAEDAFSYPLFRDLERDQRGFTTLAGFREFAANAWSKNQATRETGCLSVGRVLPDAWTETDARTPSRSRRRCRTCVRVCRRRQPSGPGAIDSRPIRA